jgi:hypothetical protein
VRATGIGANSKSADVNDGRGDELALVRKHATIPLDADDEDADLHLNGVRLDAEERIR